MSRTLNSIVGLQGLAILFLLGVVVSVGLLEKPFLSYPQLPFRVLTPVVQAGHAVGLEAYRCNSSNEEQTYLITHKLVNADNGEVTLLTGTQVQIPGKKPTPCTYGKSTVNVVPDDTAPGRYYVAGIARVDGTIRNFSVPWYTEVFEVVRKEGAS